VALGVRANLAAPYLPRGVRKVLDACLLTGAPARIAVSSLLC